MWLAEYIICVKCPHLIFKNVSKFITIKRADAQVSSWNGMCVYVKWEHKVNHSTEQIAKKQVLFLFILLLLICAAMNVYRSVN